MRRYAFIDVQNTETTTLKLLGFSIDHKKLFLYLKDKWKCEKVFFYPGIAHNDTERAVSFSELADMGAIVRPKYFFTYKIKDKVLRINCPDCGKEIIEKITMGQSWKCNCDVELTIDVVECASNDTEIFLFSGDGDFEFLINTILLKGSKVSLVSSAKKIQKGHNYSTSRLSTKLRAMTSENGSPVKFIEINNLKFQIRK